MKKGYGGKLKVIDGGLDLTDKSKKYIGLDQSYTGFAITVINEEGKYKTFVYKSVGHGVERLRDIYYFMGEEVFEVALNVVDSAMEGYAYNSTMAHMAGELGGLVKMELRSWFYDSEAKYPFIVAPAMLKKYITGKGTGVQKNQILLNVYKKWGIEFNDDNAADSYGLARIAAGMGELTYEKEIIKKLLDPKFKEKP
jgi:crossover junction endodeoxyribonuclease RuvC